MNRVSTCDLLLQLHERNPFLMRLVTGDETWILYQNVHRKRTWSKENRPSIVAKPGLHPKKVLLSIWWDWKGVVYYELLPQGETINSNKYNQLDQLKAAIAEKRPELANRRGRSTSSSILPRSCSIRLLFVPIVKKFCPC